MFEAAAKQDFVRAGRFQEQYQILLDSNDTTDPKTSSAAAANPAAMWDQGNVGPSYTFFSSLPVGSAAGLASAASKPLPGFHDHPDDAADIADHVGYPYDPPPYDYDGNY